MASHVLARQVRVHQRSFWRSPESAFFSFAMPLGVLLIFGATSMHDRVPGRPDVNTLTLFVPGILSFAVVVVAYGNLAATVTVQRAEGVLKRLRATPLRRSTYLCGQLTSVLITAVLISAVTIGVGALVFHASPRAAALPHFVLVLALGIACFAALGLAVTAIIPSADAAGAVTNGTYLPLAMVSGMFSAALQLPDAVVAVVRLFPLKALADGLRAGYDPAAHAPWAQLAVLAAWTVIGAGLAWRYFRWDP
jgi:ABC-2 type transport system permease protein